MSLQKTAAPADPYVVPALEDIEHVTEVTTAALLAKMVGRRNELGLQQNELASRVGLNRMTVVRAEGEGANPTLSNFVRLATALNLQVSLSGAPAGQVPPEDIVHRGLAYNRVTAPLEGKDREREAALAASWEAVNQYRRFGIQPLLPALLPGHTQEQATAAATVIQWLGSQVGFDFLCAALDSCGYEVREKGKKR